MQNMKTSPAFIFVSWGSLSLGLISYLVGLWRAEMQLNEKGYYLTLLLYGLFPAISVQKAVRDKLEKIPVTDLYYGLSVASLLISIILLAVGLVNAELLPSEKGFYAFGFILALFGAVAVQKNTRDIEVAKKYY